MAHVRQKFAFGVVGSFGRLLGSLEFFFDSFAAGDIAPVQDQGANIWIVQQISAGKLKPALAQRFMPVNGFAPHGNLRIGE
jgi:hypothetical protein